MTSKFYAQYLPYPREAVENDEYPTRWYLEGVNEPLEIDVNWEEIPKDIYAKVSSLVTLVLTVLTSLIDEEDAVRLTVRANHRRMMVTVRVRPSDVGFILGSQGRHIEAIRVLLTAACRKLRFHFELDIVDGAVVSNEEAAAKE